jgi:hypothetical protein
MNGRETLDAVRSYALESGCCRGDELEGSFVYPVEPVKRARSSM